MATGTLLQVLVPPVTLAVVITLAQRLGIMTPCHVPLITPADVRAGVEVAALWLRAAQPGAEAGAGVLARPGPPPAPAAVIQAVMTARMMTRYRGKKTFSVSVSASAVACHDNSGVSA